MYICSSLTSKIEHSLQYTPIPRVVGSSIPVKRYCCEGFSIDNGIQRKISHLFKEQGMGRQEIGHNTFAGTKVREMRSEEAVKVSSFTSLNLREDIQGITRGFRIDLCGMPHERTQYKAEEKREKTQVSKA